MIVRILSQGKSFSGLAMYLAHDPEAKTKDRVNWTHTLNLANDDVPCAVNEMYLTAENAELLKQEAGIRGGGRATEKSVKHLSLNWAPDQQPSREHMIETAEGFLKHMGWDEHQAILFSHNDKKHLHVHIMLRARTLSTSCFGHLSIVSSSTPVIRNISLIESPNLRGVGSFAFGVSLSFSGSMIPSPSFLGV